LYAVYSAWHHIEPLSLICDATSETLDAWTRQYILAFTGMALLALVAGHVVHIAHLNFLPEALVSVAFGALLGTILYFSTWGGEAQIYIKTKQDALTVVQCCIEQVQQYIEETRTHTLDITIC
jgi:hypothetical protein